MFIPAIGLSLAGLIAAASAQTLLSPTAPARSSYIDEAFSKGERLRYSLAWLGVVGGSATLTISPDPDGKRVRMSSVAKSGSVFAKIYPVRDEIESIVHRTSFSTLRFHKILNERSKFKEELTFVDEVRGVAIRKGRQTKVPNPVFDPLSTIYHLRRLDLTPGNKHSFDVLADGKVYSLEAEVTGRETITTEAGTFKTVVVEPHMPHGGIFRDENNRLVIWFSDDERHIPVRIRSYITHGTITATLQSFSQGRLGGR
ncbi:MAG TPA: DUF3108 domain-containing protein [Thermoanaerobaculia bacterium]|nr:DUF3108 domain-containing protein [Thermoanaerobaculia bacterium]